MLAVRFSVIQTQMIVSNKTKKQDLYLCVRLGNSVCSLFSKVGFIFTALCCDWLMYYREL